MRQGAEFSKDRQYRYALWRIWDASKPLVMFIGLNPSTANERSNDPTIRRVMRFAGEWGYGGFYMMNLFAMVTPYPRELEVASDPLGENDHWLVKVAVDCEMIIFAWGAFKEGHERAATVASRFPGAYCLGKSQGGHPKHPLYLSKDTKLIPFS